MDFTEKQVCVMGGVWGKINQKKIKKGVDFASKGRYNV